MAGSGEIKVPVKVSFEAVQESPELEKLLRQLIRDELKHLDTDVADNMFSQFTKRLAKSMRMQAGIRRY